MEQEYLEKRNYEKFLRGAFGLPQGKDVDRRGDPAGLADSDYFNDDDIDTVKAGTVYAMEIYRKNIVNSSGNDRERLENIIKNVMSSTNLNDISNLITGFNDSFVERYFPQINGERKFRDPNVKQS